ncbi:hypothetical protein E2C01_095499 [Portunus trituberculatus]|uniref:Uncharacterized protein n=1 Tax=Portunus trituberculatus TaxID=210409 RepID=A0A5B7JT66_PORTR|nr:hypothetical protein [Portunus trituberculatus]
MSHRCNAEENHLLPGDLGIGARCVSKFRIRCEHSYWIYLGPETH